MDITKDMLDSKLVDIIITKSWTTKPDGDSDESTKINGNFDFSDLTLNDVLTYAVKPLVINRQRAERAMATIPSSVSIKVGKPGARQAKEIDVDKLSPEQAQDLLTKLKTKLRKPDGTETIREG